MLNHRKRRVKVRQFFVTFALLLGIVGTLGACGKSFDKWVAGSEYEEGQPQLTDPARILSLYQMMKDTHEILHRNNVKYWADWGTLIGALRHNGIVPWDDDLDIAIAPGEEENFLKTREQFQKAGYVIEDIFFGYKIFAADRDFFIDVFRTNQSGEKIYYHGWDQAHRGTDPKLHYLVHEIFPLKLHKFGEFEVNVPNDANEEISWWAGQDWMDLGVQTHNHVTSTKKVKFKMTDEYRKPAQPTGPMQDRIPR